MVEIYCVHILKEEAFRAVEDQWLKALTSQQALDIKAYKKGRTRQQSLLGLLLTKKLIGQILSINPKPIEFSKGEHGKPFYPQDTNIHFNISHAGDWVFVALSSKAIGIDIEKNRTPQYRIANRYFSAEEQLDLFSLSGREKSAYFFKLWTLKESYLKLLGKGLTQSLNTFTIKNSATGFHLFENGKIKKDIHLFSSRFDKDYTLAVSSFFALEAKQIQIIPVQQIVNESQTNGQQ